MKNPFQRDFGSHQHSKIGWKRLGCCIWFLVPQRTLFIQTSREKKMTHAQHSTSPYLPTFSYASVPNTSQISQHFTPTRPLTRQAASCWYSLGQVQFYGSQQTKAIGVNHWDPVACESCFPGSRADENFRGFDFISMTLKFETNKPLARTIFLLKSLLFTNRKRRSSVKWCYF